MNKYKYTIYLKNGKKIKVICERWVDSQKFGDFINFMDNGITILEVNLKETAAIKREPITV